MPTEIAPPRDITIPEPGSTTTREVLSRAIRRVMQDLMRLTASGVHPDLRPFKPVLQQLLRTAPGALASALRGPTVGGLLRCLRQRPPAVPIAVGVPELLATLLVDLDHAGALAEPFVMTSVPARIVSLPSRRVFTLPDGATALRIGGGAVEVRRSGGTFEALAADSSPFTPITEFVTLATVDNNPLSMFEAHPDKEGNTIDLGGRPATDWTRVIADGLDRIDRHLPELRGEIDLLLRQVVPVGYDDHAHLSASYQEIIGTVYMTLHPHAMTMVEATIHEFQHNKLHALLELDPLLHNAFHPLYASPVRPDPRPLQGVLLAVHAFQPVARLYQLMREAGEPGTDHPEFERRYRQIVEGNHAGAEVLLAHGQATTIGQGVLDEIRRWDEHAWDA